MELIDFNKYLNFTAIDFETANSAPSSICQIGLVRVEQGEVVHAVNQLIQPPGNTYNYYNTGRPVKNPNNILYKSAYIDSPNSPMYSFGYGLSYTQFSYTDLVLDKPAMKISDSVTVSFTLKNTGKYGGEEVVQLYIRDKVASVVRPMKELKDFKKVYLKAGERKKLSFTINKEKLSFYNSQLKWVAELGEFEIMIGTASDDIALKSDMVLE